jgi:hypothetical protein
MDHASKYLLTRPYSYGLPDYPDSNYPTGREWLGHAEA